MSGTLPSTLQELDQYLKHMTGLLSYYENIIQNSQRDSKKSTDYDRSDFSGARFATGGPSCITDNNLVIQKIREHSGLNAYLEETTHTTSYFLHTKLKTRLENEIRQAIQKRTDLQNQAYKEELAANQAEKIRILQTIQQDAPFLDGLRDACKEYLDYIDSKWFFKDARNGDGSKLITALLGVIAAYRNDPSHENKANLKTAIQNSGIMTLKKGDRAYYFADLQEHKNLKDFMAPASPSTRRDSLVLAHEIAGKRPVSLSSKSASEKSL